MDPAIVALFTDLTGWSVTVPVAIIATVAILRRPLSGLLDRGTRFSAGTSGVTVEAAARAEQQQIEVSKDEKATGLPAPADKTWPLALTGPEPNAIYSPIDRELIDQLNGAFGDANEVKLAWAARLRTQALVERLHETHYRVIFTAQLYALKRLNEFVRATLSQARKVYDLAAQQNPDFYRNVAFESWVGFLINTGYVSVGTEEDPVFQMTPLGKDFLVWMAVRGVPEVKPY